MYRLGCSGWFYPHWKGRFYPEDLPAGNWFHYYTKYFDTVELNNSFYRFPKVSAARAWYRQAPRRFVYTLKVNRVITHMKKFSGTRRLVHDFYRVGDALKEKMGCFLFQLPPMLKYNENKLGEILSQLDPGRKNVLEFRHESWFTRKVYRELRKAHVSFCIVSAPGLPKDFVKTAPDLYVRFHGKGWWYEGDYGYGELKNWAAKIRKSRSRNAWAYFNNDLNACAVKNCLTLKRMLRS